MYIQAIHFSIHSGATIHRAVLEWFKYYFFPWDPPSCVTIYFDFYDLLQTNGKEMSK